MNLTRTLLTVLLLAPLASLLAAEDVAKSPKPGYPAIAGDLDTGGITSFNSAGEPVCFSRCSCQRNLLRRK